MYGFKEHNGLHILVEFTIYYNFLLFLFSVCFCFYYYYICIIFLYFFFFNLMDYCLFSFASTYLILVKGACPSGRFGANCRYSSNCPGLFNKSNGECIDRCRPGWLFGHGSTCQTSENINNAK